MKILPAQYAAALYESVSGKKEKEAKQAINNFVLTLKLNNDVKKVNAIILKFAELWNENEGMAEVEVSSARELSAEAKKEIKDYILKKTGARLVVLKENIDKKILGGAVLKYHDRVLDGSLSGRIKEFKTKLTI